MAFTYPEAKISIIAGNGFYRIKAQAVDTASSSLSALGPGDLIPIDVGFSAIAVGPESDYENYELFYADKTAPGGLQRIPFSPKCPIVGRISADNDTEYPDSGGEKAKAFIRIVDNGTLNGFIDGDLSANRIAEALADIIVYTGSVPASIPTCRVPGKRSAYIATDSAQSQNFWMPAYGRRILSLSASNAGGNAVTAAVSAVRLFRPLLSTTVVPAQEPLSGKTAFQITTTVLVASAPVPSAPLAFDFSYNADTDGLGYFDFVRVSIGTDSSALPSDSFRGIGVYINMEVRD
jgi:hypothetical protein